MAVSFDDVSFEKPKDTKSTLQSVNETGEDFVRHLLNRGTFGIGPALSDMVTGGAATEGLKRAQERSPIASTLGAATGGAARDIPTGVGLAKAGIGAGTTLFDFILNGAATGGVGGLAEEGVKTASVPGHEFQSGVPITQAVMGGLGGVFGKLLNQVLRPSVTVSSNLPKMDPNSLPTRSMPPGGTMPEGVRVTGPEAMKLNPVTRDAAAPAQSLLNQSLQRSALARGRAEGLLNERGPAIAAARLPTQQAADDAAVRAARVADVELPSRASGATSLAPLVEDARVRVSNRQAETLPGAPAGPRDSVETHLQAIDDLRAQLPRMEPAQRAAAEAQIAVVEGRLNRRAPMAIANREATGNLAGFDQWAEGMTPVPGAIDKSPFATLADAAEQVPGKIGWAASTAKGIANMAQNPRPEGVAGILMDPALTNRVTAGPQDMQAWLIEMLKRQGLSDITRNLYTSGVRAASDTY